MEGFLKINCVPKRVTLAETVILIEIPKSLLRKGFIGFLPMLARKLNANLRKPFKRRKK